MIEKYLKYEKEIVYRALPENYIESHNNLFKNEFEKTLPPTNIYIVEDVKIINELLFSNNKIDLNFFSKVGDFQLSICQIIQKYIPNFFLFKISKAIWLTDNWSQGYFHWICDVLPKLYTLKKFENDYILLLPKRFENITFVKQSLSFFRFKIIFVDKVKIDKLLLIDYVSPTGNYRPNIMLGLNNMFLKNIKTEPFRKIYISRQKANRRKINNEVDLVNLILKFGFEIHFFEDYDFETQIKIMSETKILMGLHGAGLTNMLFMPNGSSVLEIRKVDDCGNNCYYSLAKCLNLNYYYSLANADNNNTFNATFDVDTENIHNILKLLN